MHWFDSLIATYMANLNYGTTILLMTIESTFLPLPSEVIIPPAAWRAADGHLNIYLIVVCCVIGSLLGATINYLLGRYIGRGLIYRFARTRLAKMLFCDTPHLEKAEAYFLKNGASATFVGRLIPGVRHLISIPAGMAQMHFGKFLAYTAAGAAIWSAILAATGYFLQAHWDSLQKPITIGGVILAVAFVAWLLVRGLINRRKNRAAAPTETN